MFIFGQSLREPAARCQFNLTCTRILGVVIPLTDKASQAVRRHNLSFGRIFCFRTDVMTDQILYPRFARSRLEEALSDTPVVLVHGPRQCGKTTLARMVGDAAGYSYIFDDLSGLAPSSPKRSSQEAIRPRLRVPRREDAAHGIETILRRSFSETCATWHGSALLDRCHGFSSLPPVRQRSWSTSPKWPPGSS